MPPPALDHNTDWGGGGGKRERFLFYRKKNAPNEEMPVN